MQRMRWGVMRGPFRRNSEAAVLRAKMSLLMHRAALAMARVVSVSFWGDDGADPGTAFTLLRSEMLFVSSQPVSADGVTAASAATVAAGRSGRGLLFFCFTVLDPPLF